MANVDVLKRSLLQDSPYQVLWPPIEEFVIAERGVIVNKIVSVSILVILPLEEVVILGAILLSRTD